LRLLLLLLLLLLKTLPYFVLGKKEGEHRAR
jgi:hypothetical protein